MASRSRGRKRPSSEISDDISMWSKEKLHSELQKLGIKVPSSFKPSTLRQIYLENKDLSATVNSNVTASNPIQSNKDADVPNTSTATDIDISEMASNSQRISAIESQLQNIRAQEEIRQSINATTNSMASNPQLTLTGARPLYGNGISQPTQPLGSAQSLDAVYAALRTTGEPSDNFRDVDIVSQSLRQQILSGKDINLALLLIPNNESTTEHRRVDFDGIEYTLKPGDPRLSKTLTLGEFIVAFGRYKSIVCEAMPHRRMELDTYEKDIVEIAHQFGGNRFYEYHKAFSAKAAALLHQRGIKVDWSKRDYGLFCTLFAGVKTNTCSLCGSVSHTSEFCALLVNPNLEKTNNSGSNTRNFGNTGSNDSALKRGTRNQVLFQGIPLNCNNYNYRSCSRVSCKFLHLCRECFSSHPVSKCTKGSQPSTSTQKSGEKEEKNAK